MASTKEKITDTIADAADAAKNAGKKVVEGVSDAAATVAEKAKDAACATGEAVQDAGKKIKTQGE